MVFRQLNATDTVSTSSGTSLPLEQLDAGCCHVVWQVNATAHNNVDSTHLTVAHGYTAYGRLVPICAELFLSGGVDSTLIPVAAARNS
jgi:asparagine synthetase B (glutamine-hydrolysing)